VAKMVGTVARVAPTTGVWEHKHGDSGWHWASAGHRDDGQTHKDSKAETPIFVEGTNEKLKSSYFKSLAREEGFISQIAGKGHDAVLVKAS